MENSEDKQESVTEVAPEVEEESRPFWAQFWGRGTPKRAKKDRSQSGSRKEPEKKGSIPLNRAKAKREAFAKRRSLIDRFTKKK